jgi:hypothetical protein
MHILPTYHCSCPTLCTPFLPYLGPLVYALLCAPPALTPPRLPCPAQYCLCTPTSAPVVALRVPCAEHSLPCCPRASPVQLLACMLQQLPGSCCTVTPGAAAGQKVPAGRCLQLNTSCLPAAASRLAACQNGTGAAKKYAPARQATSSHKLQQGGRMVQPNSSFPCDTNQQH